MNITMFDAQKRITRGRRRPSRRGPRDHFVEVTDLIGIGSGAKRERDIRPRIDAAFDRLAG